MKKKLIIGVAKDADEMVIQNRILLLAEIAARDFGLPTMVVAGRGDRPLRLPNGVELKDIGKSFSGLSSNYAVRFFQELWLSWQLTRSIHAEAKGNTVLISIPSLLMLLFFPFLRIADKTFLDIRDAGWAYLSKGGGSSRLVGKVFYLFSRLCIRSADRVFVTNEYELRIIELMGGGGKTEILTNGLSLQKIKDLREMSLIQPKRIEPCDVISVAYVGNIGIAQKLADFLDVIAGFPNVHCKIVGDGVMREDLERRFEAQTNIEFTGFLSWENVALIYKSVDVLYLSIGEEYESAVPSKFYEYMYIGKPVILSARGNVVQLADQFSGVFSIDRCSKAALSKIFDEVSKGLVEVDCEHNQRLIETQYCRDASSIDIIKTMMSINH